jgi:D-tyrosyl-tRNA(Tyr) deacylase
MRVLLQRVRSASVSVEGERVASIGHGLLLLVGVGQGDGAEAAGELAAKVAGLRIFADEAGRFNLSALEVGAEALVVSQFTLLADTRRGRRPSFTQAAPPEAASELVEEFGRRLEAEGLRVSRGRFGAHMLVELVNDGPVTLLLEA